MSGGLDNAIASAFRAKSKTGNRARVGESQIREYPVEKINCKNIV